MTVFQLVMVLFTHPRRYPRFGTQVVQLIIASSLEKAEDYMRDYIQESNLMEDAYAFFIREIPVDVPADGGACLSERVYDIHGQLLDCRSCSSVPSMPGIFEGRTPEQIRFKPGDIVEVLACGEVHLAFVGSVPPSCEEAEVFNRDTSIQMDHFDDSYMVFNGPGFTHHMHIDALRVFPPRFKIPPYLMKQIDHARRVWSRRLDTNLC